MIFPIIPSFILYVLNMICFLSLNILKLMLKIYSPRPLKNSKLMKVVNILSMLFRIFCWILVFINIFFWPKHLEQNGLAERKYRHLVEIGLTLLAHARMPTSYWVEAFNVALYLINRLPTRVLEYVSPYEKLFHHSRSLIFFSLGFWVCLLSLLASIQSQ